MMQEYANEAGLQYRFKIRIRPDIALVAKVPSPETYKFDHSDPNCKGKAIYYPYEPIFGVSAEDSFNFGEAKDMDHLLDRYMELVAEPFQFFQNIRSKTMQWNSEYHLKGLLQTKYNSCLIQHGDMWMLKVRRSDYARPWDPPTHIKQDWMKMEPIDKAT